MAGGFRNYISECLGEVPSAFRRGMIVVTILANAAIIGTLYLGWHLSAFTALQLVSAGVLFAILEVLIFFPYRLWKSNKSEIDRLNARLAPKLKCTFGIDIPGCVSPDVVTHDPNNPHKPPVKLTWYRIRVETVGDTNVEGCKGRLLSVKRGNKELLVGDAPLLAFTPADGPHAFDTMVHPDTSEFLDFLSANSTNGIVHVTKGHISQMVDWKKMFINADDYYLQIAVVSKTAPTEKIKLKFKWTLDPATSEMITVG